jgi:hypothetical protein
MKIEVFADADSVAREAAAIIAAEARASLAAHGRFITPRGLCPGEEEVRLTKRNWR